MLSASESAGPTSKESRQRGEESLLRPAGLRASSRRLAWMVSTTTSDTPPELVRKQIVAVYAAFSSAELSTDIAYKNAEFLLPPPSVHRRLYS